MAQHGKQLKVGAREGPAYHSVKLVLLAKCNSYEVDCNTFFSEPESLLSIESLALSQVWQLFETHSTRIHL
jgi:hypothetical protein